MTFNQRIEIKIEPYQYVDEVVLFSNLKQNIIVDSIHLNGRIVRDINCLNKTNKYRMAERNETNNYYYSSLSFEIPIERENKTSNLFKSFLPCLISILIIFVGFILHHNQIDLKISLSVGSLFVIISNFIVTQRSLPNVSEFTLIDKINIGSLFIVLTTILFFAVSYRFKEKLTIKQWKLINRLYISLTACLFSIMLYVLLIG